MKYQSELINEIVDARGHKESSLHYESECVETWIEEAKGAYPKLCDYESEWLNYISELDDTGGGEDTEPPIGEFPYIVLSDVREATVDNVVPYAFKSAILKGNTKYRDIDTGDILDTFDETKNLELVSVKLPVLTTTGKNLWRTDFIVGKRINAEGNVTTGSNYACIEEYIKILPKTTYVISNSFTGNGVQIFEYDSNKNLLNATWAGTGKITTQAKAEYFRYSAILGGGNNSTEEALRSFQFELGTVATPYEPYKSNILTVNEDVTLRGIGDVRDELDLLTGKVTERIGEIVLDGSESWILTSDENDLTIRFALSLPLSKPTNIICEQFKVEQTYGKEYECIQLTGNKTLVVRISKEKVTTLKMLKQWLSQNPITVQYELATPTVKTVELLVQNQDGKTLSVIKPIEGKMVLSTSSDTIKPLFSGEIPVEAITQNLASFIDLETEE